MDNWGTIAQFSDEESILNAAKTCKKKGYAEFETYTPFPIHGMDKIMGLKDTPLPWISLIAGITGLLIGVILPVWASSSGYNMIISGKPSGWGSITFFLPITFELTILFTAFGTVFGMFFLNKLMTYHHPVFEYDKFIDVSDDKFCLVIFSTNEQYKENEAKKFLIELGGQDVETLQN